MVVLPHPDSPTNASTSPFASENDHIIHGLHVLHRRTAQRFKERLSHRKIFLEMADFQNVR